MSSRFESKLSAVLSGARWLRLFKPVRTHTVKLKSDANESYLFIEVVPESFRIWFYTCFWIYALIGIFVTLLFSKDFSIDNNPVKDTFGVNNICIFFDYPPFSYFAAALYIPITILMLLYLVLDNFRLYLHYKNVHWRQNISKTFYIVYSMFSAFTAFAFIFFVQIFATSPFEWVVMHTLPFVVIQYAFAVVAIMHYIYFIKIDLLHRENYLFHILGFIYCLALLLHAVIFSVIPMQNLFGAQLWITWGPWTTTVSRINSYIFLIDALVMPYFIYVVFIDDLETIQFRMALTTTLSNKNNGEDNARDNNNASNINVADASATDTTHAADTNAEQRNLLL